MKNEQTLLILQFCAFFKIFFYYKAFLVYQILCSLFRFSKLQGHMDEKKKPRQSLFLMKKAATDASVMI